MCANIRKKSTNSKKFVPSKVIAKVLNNFSIDKNIANTDNTEYIQFLTTCYGTLLNGRKILFAEDFRKLYCQSINLPEEHAPTKASFQKYINTPTCVPEKNRERFIECYAELIKAFIMDDIDSIETEMQNAHQVLNQYKESEINTRMILLNNL